MSTNENRNTIGTEIDRSKTSAAAERLAACIEKMEKGEIFPYSQFFALTPELDLLGKHRYVFTKARNIALRECGIVTECVTGHGLRRLTDAEIALLPRSAIARIRRISRKAITRTNCADWATLNDAEKKDFMFGQAALGAISQLVSRKSLNLISSHVDTTKKTVDLSETLKLLAQ